MGTQAAEVAPTPAPAGAEAIPPPLIKTASSMVLSGSALGAILGVGIPLALGMGMCLQPPCIGSCAWVCAFALVCSQVCVSARVCARVCAWAPALGRHIS